MKFKVLGFLGGLIFAGVVFLYIDSTELPERGEGALMRVTDSGGEGAVQRPSLGAPGAQREAALRLPASGGVATGAMSPEAQEQESMKAQFAKVEEEQAAAFKLRIAEMKKVPGAAALVDDIMAGIDREIAEGREVFSDEDLPVDETGLHYLDEGGAARMIRNDELRGKMEKLNALLEKAESGRKPASVDSASNGS